MNFSEKSYINKTATISYTIINIVLFLAYILEYTRGARTLTYLVVMAFLFTLPSVIVIILYRKIPEGRSIRYVMASCFGVMYTFAIFSTNSITTFVYVLPMYIVITLFSDVIYCYIVCITGLVVNIVNIVYVFSTIGYSSTEMADVKIRIACMVLVGIFMVLSNLCLKKTNLMKLNALEEEKDKAHDILENTLRLSESISSGISDVTNKRVNLGDSVAHIQDSMKEVSTGSMETAESIQRQLIRTEEIQNNIVRVKGTTEEINRNMTQATEVIDIGKNHMNRSEERRVGKEC